MLNNNTVISIPTSNIFEDQYTHIELVLANLVDSDNIATNDYISKYYKDVNKVIKISETYNKYLRCNGIHTVTSEEELNLFYELDGVPLTKKYYYTLVNKTVTGLTDNTQKVEVDINVYDLIYDAYLVSSILTNGYLNSESYLNALTLNTTVKLNIIFSEYDFNNIVELTTYVNSDEFSVNLLGHMNCVLFDDIIVYDIINNSTIVDILTNIEFTNKFIFCINNVDYFIEGELDGYSYQLLNHKDATIINTINLDISYVPLYKNIVYIKTYNDSTISFDMCLYDKFYPITEDYIDSEYYNLILNNKYFFETYDIWASNKLTNKRNIVNAKFYTDSHFKNIYQVETIESTSFSVVNVWSNLTGEAKIVKSYPYYTLEQKFKVTAQIPHSAGIHSVTHHIGNPNKFETYEMNINPLAAESTWAGNETKSKAIEIQYTVNKLPYENNGNIVHTQLDVDDVPKYGDPMVTQTYGTYLKDFKFFGGATNLDSMQGDLVVPCYEGFAHTIGHESYQSGIDTIYRTLNHSNISQPQITGLNNAANNFTFIFLTNKYGFTNNYMRLGDLQEMVYGKIVVCKKAHTNVIFDVPIDQWANGYDSILHIIKYDGTVLNYEAQSDTTRYCHLDMTTSIDDCNLSIFNIMTHKKTDNQTTREDAGKEITTFEDAQYYYNTVTLDNIPDSTGYNKYTVDYATQRKSALLTDYHWGINRDNNYQLGVEMQIVFTMPDTTSLYLSSSDPYAELTLYKFNIDTNLKIYEGRNSGTIYYSLQESLIPGTTYILHISHSRTSYTLPVSNVTFNFGNLPVSVGNEYMLPNPLGYEQFMIDRGYYNYRTLTNEYMSVGLNHLYDQALPQQRIDKIKQMYWNNRVHNTALLFD